MPHCSQKISILIPFRNCEKYVASCFESILSQSEPNWEIIAINDHSHDSSLKIVNEFSAHDPRIQVYSNNGEGIISALRLAYSKSTGDLITRMDADDLMSPNKLKLLKSKLIETGKGFVSTGLVKYIAYG